jgi:hypothetical protein
VRITITAFLSFIVIWVIALSTVGIQEQHLIGNFGQIAALLLGTVNFFRLAGAYSQGEIQRRAWTIFGLGMLVWTIAQLLVMYFETVLQTIAHGSFADIFWIIGYLLFAAGLALLLKSFTRTGLPIGSSQSYFLQGGIFLLAFIVLIWGVILPVLKSPNRQIFLNALDIGYPLLDFLLILLSSFLLRFSWILRGSGLSRSWILLCAGFAVVAFADFCLAYASDVNSFLNRILDPIYFTAYFLIALSAANQWSVQRRLLALPR